MSDNNLHKIFSNTDCISTEIMIDYLDGKLSEKEKNKVEVHIASCEMCRDEFEGLSLMGDKSKLSAIVVDLHNKIDEKLNTGGKKILLFRNIYKIAAALVVLISSAWFISLYVDSSVNDFDESIVSQAMEEKAEMNDSVIMEEEPVVEEQNEFQKDERKDNNQITTDNIATNKEDKFKTSDDLKTRMVDKENESEEVYMEEEIAVEEYSASTTKKITIPEDKTKTKGNVLEEKEAVTELAEDQLDDIKKEEKMEVVADVVEIENEKLDRKATRGESKRNKLFKAKETRKKSEAIMSNTAVVDNFNQALAEYNRRDYKQAIELFKQSLNVHSNPDEVHFYLAKSYAGINDTENALMNYNKVIAMAESPFYEDALWNKAHLLMELNKRKSAINTLNQLKTGKGIHSQKAEKIIDSLNITISVEEDK